MLPTIQYCSAFVILPLDFTQPKVGGEQINFEEYCCLQTVNGNNLAAFKNIDRNWW